MEKPTDIFTRQKDALAWLHEHFRKPYPSAGKFSTDCRDGQCLVQNDKSIRLKDLKKYAQRIGFDKGAAATGADRARRKEDAEIALLEEKLRTAQLSNRKEDNKWVYKEEAEIETAALVGLLQDTLSHRIHLDQGKLLHAAGGDQARGAEFAQALEDVLAAAFNELADGKRFEVGIDEEEAAV